MLLPWLMLAFFLLIVAIGLGMKAKHYADTVRARRREHPSGHGHIV